VMLETIREYGLECLVASGEREKVRSTHAAYFLALAEEAEMRMGGSQEASWLKRLDREHDNLWTAMQWSLEQTGSGREMALRLGVALRPFWNSRGYYSEGRNFLERALVSSDGLEASIRARALYAAARLNQVQGHFDRAEALCEESLALYRELGDTVGIALALHLQADIAWGRGNLALARSEAEESLALFRELGDRGEVAYLLLHLAGLAIDRGEYATAHSMLEECLAIDREMEDASSIAEVLFNLARVCYLSQGDLATVHSLLEESFALYRELGDRESIAYCLNLSGLLTLDQGDTTSARSLVEQAVALFKEMRQQHGTTVTLYSLAKVVAAQGDNEAARALHEESIAVARKAGDRVNIAFGLEGLGTAVAAQGKHVWAARLLGAAEALRQAIGAPLPPVERPSYESAVATTRDHLGEQAFIAAWNEGRKMTLEQVLAAGG